MEIELTKFSFTKAQLSNASKDEQHLFLLTGHLLMELNILTRLLAWSSEYENDRGPYEAGGTANLLTSLLYYMSKLYEGWQLVRERFTPKIQATYLPKFSEDQRQCYADLDEYFNGEGRSPIEKVRNNFGFHNHDQFELLLAALEKHPDKSFDIYVNPAPAMCVFDISEKIISFCLGRIVDSRVETIDQFKSAFSRLIADTSLMSQKLQNVLLGFQTNFVKEHIAPKAQRTVVSVTPKVNFEDINFPYFTSFPKALNDGQ